MRTSSRKRANVEVADTKVSRSIEYGNGSFVDHIRACIAGVPLPFIYVRGYRSGEFAGMIRGFPERCIAAMSQSSPSTEDTTQRQYARRRLIAGGAALFAVSVTSAPVRAVAAAAPASRTLAFRHTHTGESLSIDYRHGVSLVPGTLARVSWFLRDFRNGEARPIDPAVLDQLYTLAAITGTRAPYDVISGYRSPATNEALQLRGRGVATHSLHLEGRAIDVRLADVSLDKLRDAATSMRAGGVGFYRGSNFVHLDTGSVRRW